jgi:5-methylcytosine-specific restriction endonuclease McrA
VSITDRTRKILWGRSGNLCAYCRRVLVEDGDELSDESVVGDECHMIGEKPGAARGHLGVGRNDLSEYANLVLLCKVHHKLVDDQQETYPVESLRVMKDKHELWVKETLARKQGGKQPHFALLFRIHTGKELSDVFGAADAFLLDHDEPETEEEAKLIGGFLQDIRDWGEIWSDLESSQHVETRFSLTKDIKEIESAGFLVFGVCERRRMRFGDKLFDRPLAVIKVARPTNQGITELGALACLIIN